MKLLYNCFAGISGDMNLAAMLDLGMDENVLREELSKLGMDDEFVLEITRDERSGIYGTKVNVKLTAEETHSHSDHHGEHSHTHHHHHHTHDHSRNFNDISLLIDNSKLENNIKQTAKDIFLEIAKAEAKVHNKSVSDVHFHEVGAVDSIVDIVGAAICYHKMGIKEIVSTPPEMGGGFVKCQHGLMPVPAPATVEILKGIECTTGAVDKEMTTPTGAAILKVLVNKFEANPNYSIKRTAYGVGHRVTKIPNLLRLSEITAENENNESIQNVIDCNIDDMTAEKIAYLSEKLMNTGALDVTIAPIIMKKGRPAHKISILVTDVKFDECTNLLLKESTTIGYRYYKVNKVELPRETKEIFTPWGLVHEKITKLPDGSTKSKLEFEDIKKIAVEQNYSLEEAYGLIVEFTNSL
ncbi:MAG: UPF0272 protein [Melioribacteraceae bacterium]|nr:MAG: UPF0272 protein [Melioribacteraceae bacterium]